MVRVIWKCFNDFHGQHKMLTLEHLSNLKYSRNETLRKVFPFRNDAILEFEIPANASSPAIVWGRNDLKKVKKKKKKDTRGRERGDEENPNTYAVQQWNFEGLSYCIQLEREWPLFILYFPLLENLLLQFRASEGGTNGPLNPAVSGQLSLATAKFSCLVHLHLLRNIQD